MDLKHLRYFLEILDQGSISKAAGELGLAQPSLSQMLLRLEDLVGAKLVSRTPSGIVPTHAGKAFAKHAKIILRQMDLALQSVNEAKNQVAGKVVFGIPTSMTLVLGVPMIKRTHHELPDVSLCISEAMSGHLLEWLEDGEVDLAILYNMNSLNHLAVRTLLSEELYLVGPRGAFGLVDTRGVSSRTVPFRTINEYKLILPTMRHGLRQFIETTARAHGMQLGVSTEIDALVQIKTLVACGEGFAILSEAAVHPELISGELSAARVVDPPLRRSVHMVSNPARPRTPAMAAIEDLAVGLIRELVEGGRWLARLETGQQ